MEYIFGKSTRRRVDQLILKTKGEHHTHLAGPLELTEVYPDCTITTNCIITKHYKAAEDAEGSCYDWYTIEEYERKVDLAEIARMELEEEIDELTEYCGELVDELYETDLEYVIG